MTASGRSSTRAKALSCVFAAGALLRFAAAEAAAVAADADALVREGGDNLVLLQTGMNTTSMRVVEDAGTADQNANRGSLQVVLGNIRLDMQFAAVLTIIWLTFKFTANKPDPMKGSDGIRFAMPVGVVLLCLGVDGWLPNWLLVCVAHMTHEIFYFFVISGFLIGVQLTLKLNERKFSLGAFLSARIVTPVKPEFADVRHEMKELQKTTMRKGPAKSKVMDVVTGALDKKEPELKSDVAELMTGEGSTMEVIATGGFRCSFDAASQWIEKTLGQGANVFAKGKPTDAFKGVLFIRCPTTAETRAALAKLKAAAAQENRLRNPSTRIWVDYERPSETRVVLSFLFGIRKQLVEWKFPQESIKCDADAGLLQVGGKDVVKVEVVGDEFRTTWIDPEWASWDQLQLSNELAAITKNSKDRLANSRVKTLKCGMARA